MITKEYLERLNNLNNEKLIDVVKNYRQYGYTNELRKSAISILEERGIHKEQLQLTGKFENTTYNKAKEIYTSFHRNSKITFTFYTILLVLNILAPILLTNIEYPLTIITVLGWTSIILYFIFLLKSFINHHQFYKLIDKNSETESIFIYVFLGMPFYIFMHFYFRKKMKEEINEIH